ncbi:MAG: hypothetical protein GXX96_01660 [Planctomycetaceae bacterium]|jgi:hypothetical protein|nr:hypothetical protein [Planctomycetaceae bacterium]
MSEKSSISREEYEERAEKALQATQVASDLWPSQGSWGAFIYGDAPGGIGGGLGCFCWFDRKEQLLEYVKTHLVFLNPGPATMDPAKVAASVQETIERIETGMLDMRADQAQVNLQLQSFSQIEWWGKFSELLDGDTEFARRVRQWFRGSDDSEAPAPIVPEEEDRFAEELRSYGV